MATITEGESGAKGRVQSVEAGDGSGERERITDHKAIPFISRAACPVCGLAGEKTLRESANYRLCPSCQVIYRSGFRRALPEESWDQTYYSDDRVMDYYSRRYSGFRKMVSLMDSRVGQRKKWLDIGCGPGALLEVAHERGWQAYGIDPSSVCVDIVRTRMKYAQIALGTVEEKLREFESMTVVSVMNVLRCIEHVGAVLSNLRRVLVDGGWIIVRESNANRLRRSRSRENLQTEVSSAASLQLWTPRSLEKGLRKAGFRNLQSLPSPVFTETAGNERDGRSGVRARVRRIAKPAAWPVSRFVHAVSGGRVCLGPNFITLGQK